MSRLTPSLLALDKGLDLQTAKLLAPEGSVFDTLNYEQVDFQGQKRIDGYVRYDGSTLAAIDEYRVMEVETVDPALTVGDLIFIGDKILGVVGSFQGTTINYVVIDQTIAAEDSSQVTIRNYSTSGEMFEWSATVVSDVSGQESSPDISMHYDNLLSIMTALRNKVEHLPGPIAGLHWFKDRLYAVAQLQAFTIAGPVNINYLVYIGSPGGQPVQVVDYKDGKIYFLTSVELVAGTELYNDFGDLVFTLGNPLDSNAATFYESRTEIQVVKEDGPTGPYDFGWRAKHLGWVVNFEKGVSLFGKLAAVNQNRQDVGIEGPTTIDGTNGSPASLFQKVNISNAPQQINGWKSFDSPLAYVLDPSDIQTVDATYIYADAFVAWTADSSTVSVAGSDMQGLVEYPPNNSIVYSPLP